MKTIHVHVSGPGGIVNQGTVTFSVNGQPVSASVNANGDATASLTLPLLTAAFAEYQRRLQRPESFPRRRHANRSVVAAGRPPAKRRYLRR